MIHRREIDDGSWGTIRRSMRMPARIKSAIADSVDQSLLMKIILMAMSKYDKEKDVTKNTPNMDLEC